jgi:hypothetical protein
VAKFYFDGDDGYGYFTPHTSKYSVILGTMYDMVLIVYFLFAAA